MGDGLSMGRNDPSSAFFPVSGSRQAWRTPSFGLVLCLLRPHAAAGGAGLRGMARLVAASYDIAVWIPIRRWWEARVVPHRGCPRSGGASVPDGGVAVEWPISGKEVRKAGRVFSNFRRPQIRQFFKGKVEKCGRIGVFKGRIGAPLPIHFIHLQKVAWLVWGCAMKCK